MHPLQHRLALEQQQRLARQARGGISGRNDYAEHERSAVQQRIVAGQHARFHFQHDRYPIGNGERQPVTQTRFGQLPLSGQLFHTVSSPPVAYLLFLIGLALIVFELYTAGVGVAGVVGAGCLVLGCYGLAALPTNPVSVGLLLFAMFAYAIDVQTGVPRVWSGIATASLAIVAVGLIPVIVASRRLVAAPAGKPKD